MPHNFSLRPCAICGKKFVPAALSIYKVRDGNRILQCCSYTCWIRATKAKENRHRKSKDNLTRMPVQWYNEKGRGGEDNDK